MSLKKNQSFELEITNLSNDGNGVGRYEGMAVFVPFTAVGDTIKCKAVKVNKNYTFGIIEDILTKSDNRVEVDCPVYRQCGGCNFRHISYESELLAKHNIVKDAMERLGKIIAPVLPSISSSEVDRYRNKVQYPLIKNADGSISTGFYADRSHRIIPCSDCKLQPELFTNILDETCNLITKYNISLYDETTRKGVVRHIYLRYGVHTDEVMLCFVINARRMEHSAEIISELTAKFKEIKTVILNVNKENTNVIMGEKCVTLFGDGFIEDTMCDVPVKLSPLSFYQVNTKGAEKLYTVAKDFAQLTGDETVIDLYCGAGTIGLSMVDKCKKLIGIEIVPQAIESAKNNANKLGVADKCQFINADAGKAATMLLDSKISPDVVVLDPPRKGCDEATLSAVVGMSPKRIVMVSCNPSTAARDLKILEQNGYKVEKVQPVDMFPRTKHVETVCLLSKLNVDHHIEVELNMDELDLTSAESKATYAEIKDYVLENSGLKVTNLYIAQVKDKMEIKERVNYHVSKKEDAKVPQCPADKEKAILEALEYFNMID